MMMIKKTILIATWNKMHFLYNSLKSIPRTPLITIILFVDFTRLFHIVPVPPD